jgi:4-deoxy-L-threo-5-hexosulose-uronate ketol-isomerase
MDIHYSLDQNGFKRFTTDELRKSFLIESLFTADKIHLVYSYTDR